MKTTDPNDRAENAQSDEKSFNRDDSTGNDQENAYKAFTRDKRARTTAPRKVEYRKGSYVPSAGSHPEGGERRSFNPNFTPQNRPLFNNESENRNEGRPSSPFGYNRPYGQNREQSGEGREQGGYRRDYNNDNREGGFNRSSTYGERPRNDYQGSRPNDQRPSFNRNSDYTPRPRYDSRQEGQQPYHRDDDNNGYDQSARPQGQYQPRPQGQYQPRPQGQYQSRPQGSYQPRPQGQYQPRPQGSYQPRPQGERNYNREQGDRDFNSQPNQSPSYNRPSRPYANREQGERSTYNRQGGYGQQGGQNRRYGNQGQERDFNRMDGGRPQQGYNSRKPMPPKQYKPMGQRFDSENYPKYPAPKIVDDIRLNRYISMSGICSRRQADTYITAGDITVNDVVVTELGSKVKQGDVIKYKGEVIENEKKVYIVLNKPKGYVTSIDDPHAQKLVMDLIKDACKERLYPVGRLDKSSVGVLLITNDGDVSKRLTHPSSEKKKIYQVSLSKPLTQADMQQLADGVELEDGPIKADAIDYVDQKKTEVGVEIHSGRNRVVRRMFESLGYHVVKLDRVYYAGLTKQRLKRGTWRFLTPQEVAMLKSGSYE